MKKPRGRPPGPMIVPHPLKSGEWLKIGRYDKHYPAANWMWTQVREGMPRAKAMDAAVEKFDVTHASLGDWLQRARKRGPIAPDYDGDDNSN